MRQNNFPGVRSVLFFSGAAAGHACRLLPVEVAARTVRKAAAPPPNRTIGIFNFQFLIFHSIFRIFAPN
jgi:hypothetical protein